MSGSAIYDFQVRTIDGKETDLKEYVGRVLLIVNVASSCRYTEQYDGLEKIYQAYKNAGLVILGFPCNQFRNQETGSEAEIKSFCSLTYNVTFPMFAKIDVNGGSTHPLYQFLKRESKGFLGTGLIKWNFTKFLVDRSGHVIERFAPFVRPEALEANVKGLL